MSQNLQAPIFTPHNNINHSTNLYLQASQVSHALGHHPNSTPVCQLAITRLQATPIRLHSGCLVVCSLPCLWPRGGLNPKGSRPRQCKNSQLGPSQRDRGPDDACVAWVSFALALCMLPCCAACLCTLLLQLFPCLHSHRRKPATKKP